MTKEEAFERLDLPVGSDLQSIRKKFASMHNDYRMQIDNAFNPTSKHIFEQKLEEIKEAYAILNESEGIDDSASLPRTAESYANESLNQQADEITVLSLDQALALFGLHANHDDDRIVAIINKQIEDLNQQLASSTLIAVKQAYSDEIDKLEVAKEIVREWLEKKEKTISQVADDDTEEIQEERMNVPSSVVETMAKQKKKSIWIALVLVSILFIGLYFFFFRPMEPPLNTSSEPIVNLSIIQDSAAWKAALAANNEAAYTYYLNEFPAGIFKDSAQQNVSKLKEELNLSKAKPLTTDVNNKPLENKLERKVEVVQPLVVEGNAGKIGRLAKRLQFEYDSSLVGPNSVLEELVSLMMEEPDKRYQIMVFSDEGRSSDYEVKISEARGKSLKQYLVNKGISSSALSIYAFGNSRSTCKESTIACYKKNNRVEIEEL